MKFLTIFNIIIHSVLWFRSKINIILNTFPQRNSATCWIKQYWLGRDLLLYVEYFLLKETFCYRRRFVKETFCYGDVLLGDFLSRRRFVRRRFVCASLKGHWHKSFHLQYLVAWQIPWSGMQTFARIFDLKGSVSLTIMNCSVSRWRPQKVDKRMVLEYTHGLFIT